MDFQLTWFLVQGEDDSTRVAKKQAAKDTAKKKPEKQKKKKKKKKEAEAESKAKKAHELCV